MSLLASEHHFGGLIGDPRRELPIDPGKGLHMVFRNVAPGVDRVEDDFTNWYVIEADDGITIVDCGVPRSWASLLEALGERLGDVRAVVLTHAHFDHVGYAERARRELRVPVYVHEDDVPLTRHPWRYDHERARAPYLVTHVKALPIVAAFLRDRAFWPAPIREVVRYGDGGTLPVPGRPVVVPTPGHTLGHCALHLPDRDTVFAGDAIVTLDPYTGRTGPRLVARAATVDSERNLATLDALAATGARTVLTGHGSPWTRGVEAAVEAARHAGAA
jgi:glyoxylase-like metal-dependent hydrolase (beta-lactamase superfamily II)